jgi:hypothetical protein
MNGKSDYYWSFVSNRKSNIDSKIWTDEGLKIAFEPLSIGKQNLKS